MREWALKKEEEKLLIIKLPEENKDLFTAFFKKNHPYKTPELFFLKTDDVDHAYDEWVKSFIKKTGK